MTREWKPGDVAIIHVPDIGARRAIYEDTAGGGWNDACGAWWASDRVTARPLVVIDPECTETALEPIWRVLRNGHTLQSRPDLRAALRSLIAPEKPAEPMGLGAVVEVDSTQPGLDGTKKRLVRTHASHEPWWGDNQSREWAEISGPITVLFEGVTP